MYKYLIDSSGQGLNGLALLALLTFFFLLSAAIAVAFFTKRRFIDHMAGLPLDDAPSTLAQTSTPVENGSETALAPQA